MKKIIIISGEFRLTTDKLVDALGKDFAGKGIVIIHSGVTVLESVKDVFQGLQFDTLQKSDYADRAVAAQEPLQQAIRYLNHYQVVAVVVPRNEVEHYYQDATAICRNILLIQ